MRSMPSASFFSLATTFSLPGITTYSVSKSLSTSTPSVLLGRSFTWPSEASTVKPFPRYFWMVFAFAGDSTMTKPLANVSSMVLKLARMRWRQQVCHLSYQLSAVSSQLVNERGQHTFYFNHFAREPLIFEFAG